MCRGMVQKRVMVAGYAFDLKQLLEDCVARCELVERLRLLAMAISELPCTNITTEVRSDIIDHTHELVIRPK